MLEKEYRMESVLLIRITVKGDFKMELANSVKNSITSVLT